MCESSLREGTMGDEPIFFKSWDELGRVAIMAASAYAGFLIILRVSGKRTLAKMNVFDFVFVVALGSMLADTILFKDSTITKGLTAMTVLILIQIALSWIQTKSKAIEEFMNGQPALLFFKGKFIHEHMRKERVTEEELRAAVRAEGLGDLAAVHAIVMETDGAFSVISEKTENTESILSDVRRTL
jgi:uncharacterized membrane protein YcaP (DUF421 family)